MNNVSSKSSKYTYDCISKEKDIDPYEITMILGGTGSRKSTWAEMFSQNLIDSLSSQNCLYVTNRRPKVDETFINCERRDSEQHIERKIPVFSAYLGFDSNVYLSRDEFLAWRFDETENLDDEIVSDIDSDGRIFHNCCCTPAYLEAWYRKVFQSAMPLHLYPDYDVLNRYDYLIIDEAHSLTMDASYQSAPSVLYSIIERFKYNIENNISMRCKHLIFMTGTPLPVEEHLRDMFPDMHVIDLMKKTYHVLPKVVKIKNFATAKMEIIRHVKAGEKIIVFYSGKIMFPDEIAKIYGIDKAVIGTTFSDKKKRAELETKDPQAYEMMLEIDKCLAEEHRLPDNVQVLFATARLKEGISIENEDISYVYVSTYNQSDVVQMAGRVRNGNYELNIIVEMEEYLDPDIIEKKQMLRDIHFEIFLNSVNTKYKKLAESSSVEKLQFIDSILQNDVRMKDRNYPYLSFNYYKDEFEIYTCRIWNDQYFSEQYDIWHDYESYDYSNYSDIVSEWFGGEVEVKPYKTQKQLSYTILYSYNKIKISDDDTTYSYDVSKINKLISDLQGIWGDNYKTINKLLSLFSDFKCERCGKGNKMRKLVRINKSLNYDAMNPDLSK